MERLDVDLLARRAINRQFFPLTAAELGFPGDIDQVLRFDLLPQIRAETDKDGPLRIWPLQRFLRELADGRVLG